MLYGGKSSLGRTHLNAQQLNLHQHPRLDPHLDPHLDQLNQRVTALTIINTVLLGPPLVNVARTQLICINIVKSHVDYAAVVVEAEEAVRMQVPIVTIGRNMVTAGLIMHI